MNWRSKSTQFRLFSLLPGGTQLYTFIQEHITRSTVASAQRVEQKLQVALGFWRWLQRAGLTDKLTQGNLLDLGAGWHPSIPLLWYAFGTQRQTLVDVYPNMDAKKVNDTIRFFNELTQQPQWSEYASLKRMPRSVANQASSVEAALAHLGMEYQAPHGDLLQRQPGHYDMAICTQVLQHVPKPVQLAIFKELHHCLKPGGLFHATVHFVGQFSNPDLQTGQFEHLAYSPDEWEKRFNSRIMGFNQLKSPDYRETLEAAGFKLLAFEPTLPTANDLAELKRTAVHPFFNRYTEQELATRGLFFVAEKA